MLGVRGAIAFRFPPVPLLIRILQAFANLILHITLCGTAFGLGVATWQRSRCAIYQDSLPKLLLLRLTGTGLVWAHYRRHRQRESFVSALVKLQADGGGDDA